MSASTPASRDRMLDAVIAKSMHMMVPWFLMASWLYYHRDVSMLTDERYDRLAKDIDTHWDSLSHRHKQIIDRDAIRAGTAFSISDMAYPQIIVDAACQLVGRKEPYVAGRATYGAGTPGRVRVRVRNRNPNHTGAAT